MKQQREKIEALQNLNIQLRSRLNDELNINMLNLNEDDLETMSKISDIEENDTRFVNNILAMSFEREVFLRKDALTFIRATTQHNVRNKF